jgi:hypothetical protein
MSGDTTSSDMTWAHAACSVDKLDKTDEDGAVNDPAAHEATADAKPAVEDSMARGRLLVDRTQFSAGPFRSALLMMNRTALGGAGVLRVRHFERVVRSGERCSLYGGSTPR